MLPLEALLSFPCSTTGALLDLCFRARMRSQICRRQPHIHCSCISRTAVSGGLSVSGAYAVSSLVVMLMFPQEEVSCYFQVSTLISAYTYIYINYRELDNHPSLSTLPNLTPEL